VSFDCFDRHFAGFSEKQCNTFKEVTNSPFSSPTLFFFLFSSSPCSFCDASVLVVGVREQQGLSVLALLGQQSAPSFRLSAGCAVVGGIVCLQHQTSTEA